MTSPRKQHHPVLQSYTQCTCHAYAHPFTDIVGTPKKSTFLTTVWVLFLLVIELTQSEIKFDKNPTKLLNFSSKEHFWSTRTQIRIQCYKLQYKQAAIVKAATGRSQKNWSVVFARRSRTTRRRRFGAANSAAGQFGAGPTRRGRFGAGTFRRSVSNSDINFQCNFFCIVHLYSHMRCGMFMTESYNIWIVLTTTLKPPTRASKLNSRWTIQRQTEKSSEGSWLISWATGRRYQLCDERIQRIEQSYANYGIMDYLRGLAHNFEMNWVDLLGVLAFGWLL